MTRPADLPDYDNPPINEVVLGVQFATPDGYQQIYAGEVRNLFKDKFPKIKELEPLAPTFETFGLPQRQQINFGIVTGASHDRFWFLSESEDQLIQFQNDRFLHNWRKVGDGKNPYPHFDEIIPEYEKELNKLDSFFSRHKDFESKNININQCELTYISHIHLNANGEGSKFDDWIRLTNLTAVAADDVSLNYRQVIKNDEGSPYGRLTCEISNAYNKKNEPIIVMSITVRGTPQGSNISAALDFLRNGRSLIVKCFDSITTPFAHNVWKRK